MPRPDAKDVFELVEDDEDEQRTFVREGYSFSELKLWILMHLPSGGEYISLDEVFLSTKFRDTNREKFEIAVLRMERQRLIEVTSGNARLKVAGHALRKFWITEPEQNKEAADRIFKESGIV
jgi:hypothetical protein